MTAPEIYIVKYNDKLLKTLTRHAHEKLVDWGQDGIKQYYEVENGNYVMKVHFQDDSSVSFAPEKGRDKLDIFLGNSKVGSLDLYLPPL